jgi:hypothetical protein
MYEPTTYTDLSLTAEELDVATASAATPAPYGNLDDALQTKEANVYGQNTPTTFERKGAFANQQNTPLVKPTVDAEFTPNVKTLIRLVNDLPDGVTKPTGAQIIRLTMEAMGIAMEEVLGEAQGAQSEMLEAVRANIKKIEEYKSVIRKLESDIKFYQGKANELSEIIDLFILSGSSKSATEA